MKYNTNLKIRYIPTKKLIFNKTKKSVSLFYIFRTMIAWIRFDNKTYEYTLTIRRSNPNV